MDWVVFWSGYISNMMRDENQNFLYFLHEEDKFDCSSLSAFWQYLAKIEAISLGQLKDLHFIQEQILNTLSGILGVRICISFLIYRQIIGSTKITWG